MVHCKDRYTPIPHRCTLQRLELAPAYDSDHAATGKSVVRCSCKHFAGLSSNFPLSHYSTCWT